MTDTNRKFLQETRFEEDVDLSLKADDYWQSDESKRRVAAKFQQWIQKDKI